DSDRDADDNRSIMFPGRTISFDPKTVVSHSVQGHAVPCLVWGSETVLTFFLMLSAWTMPMVCSRAKKGRDRIHQPQLEDFAFTDIRVENPRKSYQISTVGRRPKAPAGLVANSSARYCSASVRSNW